jgi:cell pole-organizing protein PopZ
VPGAAVGGVRTLDDTIIELLRPMIRQWLDDNMPRMVEKALRIELAASLRAKGEAAKGDASKH